MGKPHLHHNYVSLWSYELKTSVTDPRQKLQHSGWGEWVARRWRCCGTIRLTIVREDASFAVNVNTECASFTSLSPIKACRRRWGSRCWSPLLAVVFAERARVSARSKRTLFLCSAAAAAVETADAAASNHIITALTRIFYLSIEKRKSTQPANAEAGW